MCSDRLRSATGALRASFPLGCRTESVKGFVLWTQKNGIFRAFLVSRHKSLVQWPMSLPCLICSRSVPRWMSVHSYAWFCSLCCACCGTSCDRGLDVMFHGDCCIIAIFFPHPPTLSLDSVLQLMQLLVDWALVVAQCWKSIFPNVVVRLGY